MARKVRSTEEAGPKTKFIHATLELLRSSGLAGAGINQVVEASRAPKGSVYHYFPGGKEQLVTEALHEADRAIGDNFDRIFRGGASIGQKVRTLFTKTAAGLEANKFLKGCPVAAVTLDLVEDTDALQQVCAAIFDRWVGVIAEGIDEVPSRERRAVSQLILATLEGGLILARAHGSKAPLLDSGASLATVLGGRFPAAGRGTR